MIFIRTRTPLKIEYYNVSVQSTYSQSYTSQLIGVMSASPSLTQAQEKLSPTFPSWDLKVAATQAFVQKVHLH